MDSDKEDHVGTLIKVNQFLKDNSAALAINPQIAAEQSTLETDTESIFQNDSIATRPLEGFTTMKSNARKLVEDIVLLVRAGAAGYYTANYDAGKLRIVQFFDNKVREARDSDLYVLADQVHDVANPVKTLLAPYLVSALDVDTIATNKQAYKNVLQLPRTEEAISMAAGAERDRWYKKCFEVTLPKIDTYMLPFKYVNPTLYDKYVVARAIDNSGGGADTNGYTVHNYSLSPGETRSWMPQVAASQQLYLRQIGGTVGAIVCTAALPTTACTSGLTLVPAQTLKKRFDELGLSPSTVINFTNPGSETVTVRAGLKN
jgi:hypothetical protein